MPALAPDKPAKVCWTWLCREMVMPMSVFSPAFPAPPPDRTAPSPVLLAQVTTALGLEASDILAAQLLGNGPVWLGLLLNDPLTLLQLTPQPAKLVGLNVNVVVAAIYPKAEAPPLIARINREAKAFSQTTLTEDTVPDLEIRAFTRSADPADMGIHEEPVTSSLHASLTQWLINR